jgi:hypothetical protein
MKGMILMKATYSTDGGTADHVHCNNCNAEIFVRVGADICPRCFYDGALADIQQEVEVPPGTPIEWVKKDFNF